jgi:hypothetical protein
MSSPTQHLKAKVRVKGRSTDFSRYGVLGLLASLAHVFEVYASRTFSKFSCLTHPMSMQKK